MSPSHEESPNQSLSGHGQSASGQSSREQSASGQSSCEQSASGQSSREQSASGQSSRGQSASSRQSQSVNELNSGQSSSDFQSPLQPSAQVNVHSFKGN